MTYGLDSDSRTQVRPDQWGCVSTCGGVRKARSASLPHSGQITWPPAGPGPSNSHLHEGHRHSLIIIFLCDPTTVSRVLEQPDVSPALLLVSWRPFHRKR